MSPVTSPLPLVDGCLLLDNSTIERITTCPTAANFYYLQKRELDSAGAALRYGKNIHSAMQFRYTHQDKFEEVEQIQALADCFASTPLETEGWRNLHSAAMLIRSYNRQYPEKLPIATLSDGRPIIEMPFACLIATIRSIPIIYTGRIDLALQNDDGLFVLDFKTTSMIGDGFWKDQMMSEQHRGYCWALKEALGIEPTGYIVQALCTRESVQNSFFDDVTGFVKPIKNGSKAAPIEFGRQRFFTKEPPGQLDEWRDNLTMQIDTFLYQYERGSFARHHKHCVGKYGECPYLHVCELPPKSRPTALASGAFKDVEWSPLNRL